MMSAVWEQCYDGYVITTAYLLFDSVRPLGVRITCFPHIQSILDSPSLTEFVSSGEQEKNGCFYFSAVPWQQHLHPLRAQSLALSFFPPPSLITSLSLDEAPPPHTSPPFLLLAGFDSNSPSSLLLLRSSQLHTALRSVTAHGVASLRHCPQYPKGASTTSSSSAQAEKLNSGVFTLYINNISLHSTEICLIYTISA